MKFLLRILVALLLTFSGVSYAQNQDFTEQVEQIKFNIDSITRSEKNLLKMEVLSIDRDLRLNKISDSLASVRKMEVAKHRSELIESKVKEEKAKLDILLSQHVNEQIKSPKKEKKTVVILDVNEKTDTVVLRTKIRERSQQEVRRSRGGFNFAIGLHNLNHKENDPFRVWGSNSLEIGYSRNFRIMEKNNLLHLNYGLSLMINKLKMKGNDYFVKQNDVTSIEPYPSPLSKSKFKVTYLTLPINLDFDFTPSYTQNGTTYYPIKKRMRMGFGGYVGVLTGNKQVLRYRNDHGKKVREADKGDFNVNQWIYGISAHIGYGSTVFYAKYNLTPLFENNPEPAYPFSFGIRFGG